MGTMKLFSLAFLIASSSAFDLSKLRFGLAAPPTEIEYGFCDGSPEPASIDNISVEPFPILVQNGASVTLAVQANKKKRKQTLPSRKIKENKRKKSDLPDPPQRATA